VYFGFGVSFGAGVGKWRSEMVASTNRILFAIVVLLFALVLKLVSTGGDLLIFAIALFGLGFGWYGVMKEPRSNASQ
jgi:hypothetical protein